MKKLALSLTRLLPAFPALALPLLATLLACAPAHKSAPLDSGEFHATGIIGGKKADGSEEFAKSVVALFDTQRGTLCTASILSDSTLVTAAHCFSGPTTPWRIIFGTDIRAANRIMRNIVSFKTSPMWPVRGDESTNSGDIAVVHFTGGLPPGYHPATILDDASVLQTGTTVLLAGYGVEDGVKRTGSGILRSVETELFDPKFSETEMAVDQTKGKGACHGDSGGPAYVKVGDHWMLWGVTNHGINDVKDRCDANASYALIPFYKNWLAKATRVLKGEGNPQDSGHATVIAGAPH